MLHQPLYWFYSLTRVTKSYLLALGTTQISSDFTKHWTKFLTHQTGNYPVTCFVSKPSTIVLVLLLWLGLPLAPSFFSTIRFFRRGAYRVRLGLLWLVSVCPSHEAVSFLPVDAQHPPCRCWFFILHCCRDTSSVVTKLRHKDTTVHRSASCRAWSPMQWIEGGSLYTVACACLIPAYQVLQQPCGGRYWGCIFEPNHLNF